MLTGPVTSVRAATMLAGQSPCSQHFQLTNRVHLHAGCLACRHKHVYFVCGSDQQGGQSHTAMRRSTGPQSVPLSCPSLLVPAKLAGAQALCPRSAERCAALPCPPVMPYWLAPPLAGGPGPPGSGHPGKLGTVAGPAPPTACPAPPAAAGPGPWLPGAWAGGMPCPAAAPACSCGAQASARSSPGLIAASAASCPPRLARFPGRAGPWVGCALGAEKAGAVGPGAAMAPLQMAGRSPGPAAGAAAGAPAWLSMRCSAPRSPKAWYMSKSTV